MVTTPFHLFGYHKSMANAMDTSWILGMLTLLLFSTGSRLIIIVINPYLKTVKTDAYDMITGDRELPLSRQPVQYIDYYT